MSLLKEGALYNYKNKRVKLVEMKLHEGDCTLVLEDKDQAFEVKKKWSEYEIWSQDFKFVAPPAPIVKYVDKPAEPSLPAVQEDNSLINQLKNNLVEDIARVRTNKEYIPQAKQACNTTNTLLNLVKIQIQLNRRG